MLGACVLPDITLRRYSLTYLNLSTILACPALPGLTVFGFKAYAIVTYSSILKGLQLTPYGYLYTTLNYNEIKIGLHGRIRTYSLLTPDQAVYQIDITQR